MKKPAEFSFEAENEEKRNRDNRKNNVIKPSVAKNQDSVFYVGSLDLIDPYSGKNVYVPSKEQLEEIEAKELREKEQVEEVIEQGESTSDAASQSVSDTTSQSVSDTASQSELDLANEIFARLMAEAAADEAAKAAEIEAIKREQEATDADFNAETGSYSGLYGKKPMSDSESDMLASILNTNNSYNKSFEDLLKENQG